MWVLSNIIKYEGEEILGVFSAKEKALEVFENKKWEYRLSTGVGGEVWVSTKNGDYCIAQFEVDCEYEYDTGVARKKVK